MLPKITSKDVKESLNPLHPKKQAEASLKIALWVVVILFIAFTLKGLFSYYFGT